MKINGFAEGSSISAVMIGVADLAASESFYADRLGLVPGEREHWSGREFEGYWGLPAGTGAETVVLSAGGATVGRVVLIRFDADGAPVRDEAQRRFYGLSNLNFYVEDVMAAIGEFREAGYPFWSMPVSYQLADEVGAPTEVVFEGPDGVPINLVELSGGDPGTSIGEMATYVAGFRDAEHASTPVVSSAHTVRSREKAVRFYETVIGMRVYVDQVLEGGPANHRLSLPEGSQTHITFLRGRHPFGKVVLAQPLNYECVDLSPRAAPPNIGYFCQAFEVDDIAAAAEACPTVGAEIVAPVAWRRLPGRGEVRSMLVRCPGSGALQELVEQRSH